MVEAEENGYFYDEDVNTYICRFDYTVTVSKENEKDGFEHYFIICRPAIVGIGVIMSQ